MKSIFEICSRKKVPLVKELIIRQPIRTLTGMCGIAVACLLMFVQLGLRDGLYNQSVKVHEALLCDAVVINRDTTSQATMRPVPKERIGQIYGQPEVMNIEMIRVRPIRWRNQLNGKSRNVLAIGIDPDNPPLKLGASVASIETLKGLFNILFDSYARKEFGPIRERVERGLSVSSEYNGYRLNVSGLIKIGPSFAYDGYIVASRSTVEALVTDGTDGDAELGCIQLAPTAWAEESVERIKQRIPTDIRLLTKQQYIDFEKNYWRKGSSIGFVFNFGAILGMLVGAAMIYQVLYADVSDHLGEYATLRAMGYPMIYLCMIVIRQGITMCLVGFAPSILISAGAYHLIRRGTNIVVSMSAPILANVLVLTLLASTFSAILVTRRLWSADPVDLF